MNITPELISRIEKYCLDSCRSFPQWAIDRCERETGVYIDSVRGLIGSGKPKAAYKAIKELQAMLERWKVIPWKMLPPDVWRRPGESAKEYLNRCFIAGGYLNLISQKEK